MCKLRNTDGLLHRNRWQRRISSKGRSEALLHISLWDNQVNTTLYTNICSRLPVFFRHSSIFPSSECYLCFQKKTIKRTSPLEQGDYDFSSPKVSSQYLVIQRLNQSDKIPFIWNWPPQYVGITTTSVYRKIWWPNIASRHRKSLKRMNNVIIFMSG